LTLASVQLDLLEPVSHSKLPEGFVYRPELISRAEAAALIHHFGALPFRSTYHSPAIPGTINHRM
jgi:hypothetical protein